MPTLPGGGELIIVLFIVLLLFGAKKLPGLAGSIGTSMKELRRAAREEVAPEDDERTGSTTGALEAHRDDDPSASSVR